MLRSEFEVLTGIYVTEDLYEVINERYQETEGDKREFCNEYRMNVNGLAQKIQQETFRRQYVRMDNINGEIKKLQDEIGRLREELDSEQEWEPYQVSAMNTVEYEKLKRYDKPLSREGAAQIIAEEFGFAKERIDVLDTIPIYKKNRHGHIKKFGIEERTPIYDASDYNYIRFDVYTRGSTFSYEMVNGELETYKD